MAGAMARQQLRYHALKPAPVAGFIFLQNFADFFLFFRNIPIFVQTIKHTDMAQARYYFTGTGDGIASSTDKEDAYNIYCDGEDLKLTEEYKDTAEVMADLLHMLTQMIWLVQYSQQNFGFIIYTDEQD